MKTTIWTNELVTIPMDEVSHLINEDLGYWVIFKYSKINQKSEMVMKYEPAIWFDKNCKFRHDWCKYRVQLTKQE